MRRAASNARMVLGSGLEVAQHEGAGRLFGRKGREAARARVETETERLRSLTDVQLAAEVMSRFGSFGADADDVNVGMLGKSFVPDAPFVRGETLAALWKVIDEGAQTLQEAGLLNSRGWGGAGDGNVYVVTRKGRTALEQHAVDDLVRRALG